MYECYLDISQRGFKVWTLKIWKLCLSKQNPEDSVMRSFRLLTRAISAGCLASRNERRWDKRFRWKWHDLLNPWVPPVSLLNAKPQVYSDVSNVQIIKIIYSCEAKKSVPKVSIPVISSHFSPKIQASAQTPDIKVFSGNSWQDNQKMKTAVIIKIDESNEFRRRYSSYAHGCGY